MVLDWTLLLKPKEGRRGKEVDELARGGLDRQSEATGSRPIWPWIKNDGTTWSRKRYGNF